VEYQKIKMAFDEKSFDEVAFGFDEMVFDQVVDSIKMAFDEVVGRRKNAKSTHSVRFVCLPGIEFILIVLT
jgi:hypothetical protein